MSTDHQLSLDAFDRSNPPLCGDDPARNGFRRLCCWCPFAVRNGGLVYCERFKTPIRARDKYGLPAWKEIRSAVLERDENRCAVCGGGDELHIHHLDSDPTNDDPENLITLCGICHARVHAELRRKGGAGRVVRMLLVARCRSG